MREVGCNKNLSEISEISGGNLSQISETKVLFSISLRFYQRRTSTRLGRFIVNMTSMKTYLLRDFCLVLGETDRDIETLIESECVKTLFVDKNELMCFCIHMLFVIITIQLLLAWLCPFGDQCSSFTLY